VLPISAGAVGRFSAMEVKLNGVTANTKPSSGRWSSWFHVPAGLDERLLGDSRGVGDVEPPEVDELTGGVDLRLVRGLALPEHRRGVDSAALRKIAARSAKGIAAQAGWASKAEVMARSTSWAGV
jgi:hypothetical protein